MHKHDKGDWPISQTPQCICSISQDTSHWNRIICSNVVSVLCGMGRVHRGICETGLMLPRTTVMKIQLKKNTFDSSVKFVNIWIVNSLTRGRCKFTAAFLQTQLTNLKNILITTCKIGDCRAEPHWWQVDNGSGNGLMPSGKKSLPEPMLTHSYVPIWRHYATIS